MAQTIEAANKLIIKFYEAAQDLAQLPEFLALAARQFNAHIGGLRIYDSGATNSRYFQTTGISSKEWVALEAVVSDRNLWRVRGFPQMLQYGVAHDEMCLSERELLRSDFYNEWLVPLQISHGMGMCLWAGPPGQAVVLAFNSPAGVSAYGDAEMQFARRLLPHFRSAYSIMRRLSTMESESATHASALDRLNVGTLFVDSDSKYLHCNAAGDAVFASTNLLRRSSSRMIWCTDRTAQRRLRASIRLAALSLLSNPERIPVLDPGGVLSFVLIVSMLRNEAGGLSPGKGPCAAIFIHTANAVSPRPEAVLRDAFGLTPAESRVALLLSKGETPSKCADTLDVSLSTVKTQMRNLFAKTGTSRQAELISSLSFVLRVA